MYLDSIFSYSSVVGFVAGGGAALLHTIPRLNEFLEAKGKEKSERGEEEGATTAISRGRGGLAGDSARARHPRRLRG